MPRTIRVLANLTEETRRYFSPILTVAGMQTL